MKTDVSKIKNLQRDVDEFTRAYIETAFWSSTLDPFDECPQCGKEAILCRWNDDRECVCADCSNREPNHEPPADENYSWSDLSEETLAQMVADCREFQEKNQATIEAAIETGEVKYGPDFGPQGRAGHDFWLTRNGHGCGFWDGDWPDPYGDQLTEASKQFGEFNLYVGDSGKIFHA